MKKTSVSTNGSNNRLSYLDSYEEIIKYKKSSRTLFTRRNADIVLNRGTRWFLFVLFFLIQILMNMDHGTMPAATEDIRKDLSIDDDILGIFGSLVFLGNLIGTLFLFIRFNSFVFYDKFFQQKIYVYFLFNFELNLFVYFYNNRYYLGFICK
jgi:hypothetical protein